MSSSSGASSPGDWLDIPTPGTEFVIPWIPFVAGVVFTVAALVVYGELTPLPKMPRA